MSLSCIFNLKLNSEKFEEVNQLANDIIRYANNNGLGVFFNIRGYKIITQAEMETYFILSNSFLYENGNELLSTQFINDFSNEVSSKLEFVAHFKFFEAILKLIFNYKVNIVEIYIDSCVGTNIEDFDVYYANQNNFLDILYKSIINSANFYAYGFPTAKYIVSKQ